MLDFQQFTEGMQTPTKRLNVKELREREEFWRALWSWIDDEVKYFALRVGQQVRIVRRDYKGFVGELGQVHFDLSEIELHVYEKTYNYNDGQYYYEDKTIKLPSGGIAWHEFIHEVVEASVADQYEVEPIPESAEATGV